MVLPKNNGNSKIFRNMFIKINKLILSGSLQQRVETDEATIHEYAELMEQGTDFHSITVYHDQANNKFWVVDGFMRVEAAKLINLDEIKADVFIGTYREAFLASLGANGKNGRQRTNADKRKAARTALLDDELRKLANTVIADQCQVSHTLVGDIRREMIAAGEIEDCSRTYMANGVEKTMEPRQPSSKPEEAPADDGAAAQETETPAATAEEKPAPEKSEPKASGSEQKEPVLTSEQDSSAQESKQDADQGQVPQQPKLDWDKDLPMIAVSVLQQIIHQMRKNRFSMEDGIRVIDHLCSKIRKQVHPKDSAHVQRPYERILDEINRG